MSLNRTVSETMSGMIKALSARLISTYAANNSVRLEPSKPQLSKGYKPNNWFAATAIVLIILSALIAVGFLQGYLDTASTYFERYFAGESQVPSTVFVIATTAVVPIIASLAGAALLLLHKWRTGIYVTFAATTMYPITDAIYIGTIWDGSHVIYAYTHAIWFVTLYFGYGSYGIETAYAFYLLYLPLLLGVTASLLIGLKKSKLSN